MSEVKNHLIGCNICQKSKFVDQFEVLKFCKNDYHAKIVEALMIRKFGPRLNKK